MSKTSSKNAIQQSHPRQIGVIPHWVDTYDEVVYFDQTTQTVRCKECKEEVKNLGWARLHMAQCFGIES